MWMSVDGVPARAGSIPNRMRGRICLNRGWFILEGKLWRFNASADGEFPSAMNIFPVDRSQLASFGQIAPLLALRLCGAIGKTGQPCHHLPGS